MNSPSSYVYAYDKVVRSLSSINDISQCGTASKLIDAFEGKFGNSAIEIKNDVHYLRNYLCDITFNLYFKKYGRK